MEPIMKTTSKKAHILCSSLPCLLSFTSLIPLYLFLSLSFPKYLSRSFPIYSFLSYYLLYFLLCLSFPISCLCICLSIPSICTAIKLHLHSLHALSFCIIHPFIIPCLLCQRPSFLPVTLFHLLLFLLLFHLLS